MITTIIVKSDASYHSPRQNSRYLLSVMLLCATLLLHCGEKPSSYRADTHKSPDRSGSENLEILNGLESSSSEYANPAATIEYSFPAIADAWVSFRNWSANSYYLYVHRDVGTFLKFDLNSIPKDRRIDTAKIRVWVTRPSRDPIHVYHASHGWEDNLFAALRFRGGLIATITLPQSSGWQEIDVTRYMTPERMSRK